jgi:hypothetical protein
MHYKLFTLILGRLEIGGGTFLPVPPDIIRYFLACFLIFDNITQNSHIDFRQYIHIRETAQENVASNVTFYKIAECTSWCG